MPVACRPSYGVGGRGSMRFYNFGSLSRHRRDIVRPMRMGERARRRRHRAIVIATTAVLSGMLGTGRGSVARAVDRTFNVSLVGSLNPLAGAGSTNNIYSDLWADGSLVVLGSVGTTSGGGVTVINNANPAVPQTHSRYVPVGTANGQFRDVLVRNNVGYFAIDSALSGTSTVGGIHIVDLAN